ncbi:MAG: thioredoxin family protein [Thermoplasmata archaeon]|nr:thioredoxin family protein [Thermoplasmata archaeon]
MERLGKEAFAGDRLDRAGTWVVAFVADWCPFCDEFLPRYTARRPPVGARLALADLTDVESPLWDRFRVDVIPTVLIFEDGREIARKDGVLGVGLGDPELDSVLRSVPASH